MKKIACSLILTGLVSLTQPLQASGAPHGGRSGTPGARPQTTQHSHLDERNHIFARRDADWHRDWDRGEDHFWQGHRCRFVDGQWIVFNTGFYPFGYDYPYGYSYPGAYGFGVGAVYGPQVYTAPAVGSASYTIVVRVQSALRVAGYNAGPADGVLGPSTEAAISRYQRDHRLVVTGSISGPLIRSLRLS